MRLFLIACWLAMTTSATHAASKTDVDVSVLPSPRHLYCAGDYGNVAFNALGMHLSMDDNGVVWVERSGSVKCRYIEKRDVWFVDESGLRMMSGTRPQCVRFEEYRLQGDSVEMKYGLPNGAVLYRWEWVECRK